jgi:hypothetical protein
VTDTDIATHIRSQIAELDAEREALTDALAALDHGATARADSELAGRRRNRTRASAQVTAPAAKVVPLGKILQLLTGPEGQTTSALAKTTGGDQSRILVLLKEAEADDKVKRSGERRATRWHLVTGDSKPAARVDGRHASSHPGAARKRRAARRTAAANRKMTGARSAARPDREPTAA